MSTETMDPPKDGTGATSSTAMYGSIEHDPASSLATRMIMELVASWRRGEPLRVEDVLERHPELDDDAAIRLIYEESCLRQEAGLEVDPAEIAARFPRWRDELVMLLDCGLVMEMAPTRVVFPHVGESMAGFRLIGELGHGAAGRVYLAAQPSLGDRPVVLKVVPRGREEHLSLARLQHMNIVPLYSEHVVRDRNLQLLCMPFLGGATLSQILKALRDRPVAERTGAQIVEILDRFQAHRPVGLQSGGPLRRSIARATYVEAICWIAAALADGLHYAHERDLVHMDVKPSNALLAGDGQPMLLDFHLARGPIDRESPPPDWLGGTREFMSPEQRRAMASVREGRPIRDTVDGRADIYSLGMLMYVALGGAVREPCSVPPIALARRNSRVSIGLSDIVEKCLRDDPEDRYSDAAELAADLRRHLAARPLRGVRNRSWIERWRKWRRRHPSALSRRAAIVAVLIAAIAAPAATLAIAYRQRRDAAAAALAQGRGLLDRREYEGSAAALRSGLALIEHLPGFERQRQELAETLDAATRAGRVAELHDLANSIRFRYGISPPPAEEVPALLRLGRKTWEARETLLHSAGDIRDPEAERRIRADLRDLVVLWADLRVGHAAAHEIDKARQEAAGILTEAGALLGPSPSLDRDRRAYGNVGRDEGSPGHEAEPRSAWEHLDLGRSYLRSGKVDLAHEQFRRGLALRPQDFWLNFYDGSCAYRLGRFDKAVSAFRVCIALAPETAECYYNRALAYQAIRQLDHALADLDRALELSPHLADAALNRGIIHFQQGKSAAAIADLRRACEAASTRSMLGIAHYNLALVYQERGDRVAAVANAHAAIGFGNREARELIRHPDRPASAE